MFKKELIVNKRYLHQQGKHVNKFCTIAQGPVNYQKPGTTITKLS